MHCMYLAHSASQREPFPNLHPIVGTRNRIGHLPLFYPKSTLHPRKKLRVKSRHIEQIDINTMIKAPPGYCFEFFSTPESPVICLNQTIPATGSYLPITVHLWNPTDMDYIHHHLQAIANIHITKDGKKISRSEDNFRMTEFGLPPDHRTKAVITREMRDIMRRVFL